MTTHTPDAIVHFTEMKDGSIHMEGLFSGEYQPHTNKVHATLEALREVWPDIVHRVHGRFTDADRFNALADFAELATTDKERFEYVNVQLQAYEEQNGLGKTEEGGRTRADYVNMANFLIHILMETAPKSEPQGDGSNG